MDNSIWKRFICVPLAAMRTKTQVTPTKPNQILSLIQKRLIVKKTQHRHGVMARRLANKEIVAR